MRYFVLGRRGLLCACAAIAVISVLLYNFPAARTLVASAVAGRELPIYCVDTDEKKVALTFDAAWGNEDTHALAEIFKEYDVPVTFFVTGGWAESYPESVKELYDAGHDIMNHSDRHEHMSQMTASEIEADVGECSGKIAAVTGVYPDLFRPPYGDYNDTLIKTVRENGYYPIQWDVDSLDWKDITPDEIKKRVLSKVGPGSIVLFHNGAKNTPAALPAIIEALKNEGYTFVKVSELIIREDYAIDHAGRQHKSGAQ
ncbi:MAG: polysaccharide deacetylase family protein [Clostridia bacterium]|nr:polysaccharide deacetylase family protein [Clostridia bacterium]